MIKIYETRRGRGNNAFTLIELLVCVSIIMILIAMLMPALGRVRLATKRVVCLNNMKQVSLANFSYASESGGKIAPTVSEPVPAAVVGGTLASPFRCYLVRWRQTGDIWWNLSNLYTTGYVSDPGIFFCNGTVPYGTEMYSGSDGEFGIIPSPDAMVRSDYFYNPYEEGKLVKYGRLSKIPPEKIMVMDRDNKVKKPEIHGRGINAVRFDGSGGWHKSPTVIVAALGYSNIWADMVPFVNAVEFDQ